MMTVRCEPPTTGDATAEQVDKLNRWQRRIYLLTLHAAQDGVVVTISNPPNQPLAMGNYDLVVDVRPLRNYKG